MRDLKSYGYDFSKIRNPNITGEDINHLIVISKGNKKKHDSGFPYIRIFGVIIKDKNKHEHEIIDLGWHDHFVSYVPINVDSLGKSITRVMPWLNTVKFKIGANFMGVSSFMIGKLPNNIDKTLDAEIR